MKKRSIFGYCRVSGREQNPTRQILAMQNFGVPKNGIAVEKISGKDFNRPVYQALLKRLKPGDTLVIKSLDRLGRNRNEVIEQFRLITKEVGAAICVIDMPLLNSHGEDGDFTSQFISELFLQIVSYFTEFERRLIRQRCDEGIAAAKESGVKLGRPASILPENFDEIYAKWVCGDISSRTAGGELGVSHTTFLSWAKKFSNTSG